MTRSSVRARCAVCVAARVLVPFLMATAAALPAAAGGVGETSSYTITTAVGPTLGTYLTDAYGHALYYSTSDFPGVSNCTGGCEAVWQPFTAATIKVAPPLHAGDFGFITRENGRRQVTFRGWPLYTYSRDWAPHDTNGQGLYGSWYVVQPALFGPSGS